MSETGSDVITFDDPLTLASEIVTSGRQPLLVGLDIDGVLAPIVDHAEDALLLPGVGDDVVALSGVDGVCVVAAVSGRDLASIDRRFGFSSPVVVVGSHGLERRGDPVHPSPAETELLSQLDELATRAAEQAGDGAWVERKAMSVVLHTREAAPGPAVESTAWLTHAAEQLDDVTLKAGHHAVELIARPTSKATAIAELRAEFDAAAAVFVGDDVTDEEVFASFGPRDWSVRVGAGATVATRRLADPAAVQRFLRALADSLAV